YEHALRRGAPIYAEVLGYALNNEAWHMTTPLPSGESIRSCMRGALASAGLVPTQIDYINAHASGTRLNDSNECACIRDVFGNSTPRQVGNSEDSPRIPPISGTKSFNAHPLGATGAMEMVICALALTRGYIPPTLHHRTPDPECDLDIVPNIGRQASLEYVMNNAFGFGGINACVVLGRVR